MLEQEMTLKASDGHDIFVRHWLPEEKTAIRGVVHINHGMAEHCTRYRPIAERMTREGIVVFAHDHRGHGRSVANDEILGHYADHNGWNKVIGDVKAVNSHIHATYPDLPLTILGHSMGSFIARAYCQRHGNTVTGIILSGSSWHTIADVAQARAAIAVETVRLGDRGRSPLLDALTFVTYNKQFEPTRTGADWLSRDPREVDKYVNDPLCGYLCTNKMWSDMIDGIDEIRSLRNIRKLPKSSPVLIFSGEKDPLSYRPGKEHLIRTLTRTFESCGLNNLTMKLFPNGRHEALNETNRQEVVQYVIDWLEKQQVLLPAQPKTAGKKSKRSASRT